MDYTLPFFTRKKRNQKALVTASSPIAIGFTPYVHFVPKNDKLTYGSDSVILLTELHSLHSSLQMPRKESKL